MRTVLWLAPVLVLAVAVTEVLACEPQSEPHDVRHHDALAVAKSLTLIEVIERTLSRYPEAAELAARLEQARAWQARSASLLSDQPSLSFRYQTDRWGDDAGLREYEGGVELPLWRWGERRAARSLARAMASQSGTVAAAMRWRVAGLLRAVLWDMADAERILDSAQHARDITLRLQAAVERRHELGDVPLGDILLARSAALGAEEAVVDAAALVVDSQRQFRVLTGLDVRPPFRTESLQDAAVIAPDHPALALAKAELDGARARTELTRHSARGAPTLLVGPRWERAPLGNTHDDSIGVTFRLPIPGTSHPRTEVADAHRDQAAAQTRWDRLARRLELALHEAAHGLEVARANLETTRRRAELVERHVQLGRSAYDQGEMDLMDLLRLQQSALAVGRHRARLEVEVNRQIALFNQAVGELP